MTGPLLQWDGSSFASSGSLFVSFDSMSAINWAMASSADCHRVAMLIMSRNMGLRSSRILFCRPSHSRMEHYFFSYLLIGEVYLIEVLEIIAQMLQYIFFLKPESNKGEFRL